jgi:outer membrane protein assembly factor BamB
MWRAILIAVLATTAYAGDWPQFLGPARNGTYVGNDIADAWPAGGPKVLWKHDLGTGWSGPVVASGKLIVFHRVQDKETVECLDALSGKPIWKADYDTVYTDDFNFDNGPRATPAIAGDRVYTFGAAGDLNCWELASGKRVWNVDTKETLKADKGFFGIVCSPLIEGDVVILNVGGTNGKEKGAGIAAFDKASGKVVWQATDHEAGYSSPVAATIGGKRYVLSLTRAGLVALEPKSGKVFFEHPFRARSHASVNAATPVVVEDQVFLTASYGVGGALLKFDETGPKEVWANDDALSAHYATPVYRDGYLYGFDGRQEQGCNLRCVELKSGKVMWDQKRFGAGTAIVAGGDLLIMHEKGELIRAAALPDGFKVKQRAQVIGADVRAYPALANGLFFARDKGKLVCVDLRK